MIHKHSLRFTHILTVYYSIYCAGDKEEAWSFDGDFMQRSAFALPTASAEQMQVASGQTGTLRI
jgi:hypothetical protein